MLARIKPILVAAVVALYAGTMLLGQSLHVLLGCEHLAGSVEQGGHNHDIEKSAACDNSSGPALSEIDHEHPADCPVCQFHSQGQISSAPPASEFGSAISTELPLRPLHLATVELSGSHSPRGPPRG